MCGVGLRKFSFGICFFCSGLWWMGLVFLFLYIGKVYIIIKEVLIWVWVEGFFYVCDGCCGLFVNGIFVVFVI